MNKKIECQDIVLAGECDRDCNSCEAGFENHVHIEKFLEVFAERNFFRNKCLDISTVIANDESGLANEIRDILSKGMVRAV